MKIHLIADLDAIKAAALERIDHVATVARRELIPDPSIEPVWRRKAEAARTWLSAGGEVPTPIAAEIGVTGPDADAVARIILAKAEALDAELDRIEARRIAAKAAVRRARTQSEIEAHRG